VDAILLLDERPAAATSLPLVQLRVEALAILGRAYEALELVETGLLQSAALGQRKSFVDLALLGGKVAEDAGFNEQALDWLEQGRDAAQELEPALTLACGVAQLRLYRKIGSSGTNRAERLRQQILYEASQLTSRDRTRNPALMRDLAAEVGIDAPEFVMKAVQLVGMDADSEAGQVLGRVLSDDDRNDLNTFLESESSAPISSPPDPTSLNQDPNASMPPPVSTTIEQGQQIAEYLDQATSLESSSVSEALVESYQYDSDQPTFDLSAPLVIDPSSRYGYRRSPELQEAFEQAASTLRATDGWSSGQGGERHLCADLVLDGGGVKLIGLIGAVLALGEAGYTFPRSIGTSGGALCACLVAALQQRGEPIERLKSLLDSINFASFMPAGRHVNLLADHYGEVGTSLEDLLPLVDRMGLYSGDYLVQFLEPVLRELGVQTFQDLKITPSEDPGMSLDADHHQYRLAVQVADITRRVLAQLPWDYRFYGTDPGAQSVVQAVRASMALPLFLEPVTYMARPASIDTPMPDGTHIVRNLEGGPVTWVDGTVLRLFPLDAFSRVDGGPARWPTVGIKFAQSETWVARQRSETALSVALNTLRATLDEWDTYAVGDTTKARTTIWIPSAGLTATNFGLTIPQQNQLFLNGVAAATDWVIEMGSTYGVVPRTADQGRQYAIWRRARPGSR